MVTHRKELLRAHDDFEKRLKHVRLDCDINDVLRHVKSRIIRFVPETGLEPEYNEANLVVSYRGG